ncbi:single-stranded DNA-binding protein [Leifsonia sp. Leaf264]|uniref:single-stranded DNA-binding protein n=1 Tax=Leifsonia sp. Leaf264 TaxID=1736314 RepID=UPI0006F8BBD9|nr:single-stranded DNA-binding protein [Leifsonia sp. Leaf264]KQO98859.1 hypothetical protein ASF30_12415 [Leifsonia sp. Leaf264]
MTNQYGFPIVGNLTADPELRYTQSGVAVANFTIASTPRVFDRESGQFKDGEPLFIRASLWREYAENFAASAHKGDNVFAIGELKQRSYETKEGEKRTVIELEVDEVGPTLRFGTTTFTRRAKNTPTTAVAAAPVGAPAAAAVAAPAAAVAAPAVAAPVAAPVAVPVAAAPAAVAVDDDDYDF